MNILDWIEYKFYDFRDRFNSWKFWKLTGFPFKRRCPLCAGTGSYSSESMARYGDKPHVCDTCRGTGKVKR
jgi:DnaJ-class molecular chaperone